MGSEKAYQGSCFCGAVEFTVTGEPAAMGYCHCESCRHWSGGPVNTFSLWNPKAIKITKGAGNIGTYNKTPQSDRKWCKTCGGHFFTKHQGMGLTDVYAAAIPTFSHQPAVHVNYQETTLAHQRRFAQVERLPGGNGWFR
jgi:hypothetical protein